MICPKCKSQNDNNAMVCSECGFKLKLKCPYCGAFNPVGAKVCSSCSQQLLKICPACKAVNFAQAKICRKCSAPFEIKQISENESANIPSNISTEKEKYASVAVELINISSIKTNIKSEEMSQKIIAKFYQVFAKSSKDINLKPLKVNESTLVVEFSNSPSFVDSITSAVKFTGDLDKQFDEISSVLEAKLKVSYKLRYLISTNKPSQKSNIISSIGLGVVDDIIFSEDVRSHLETKMLFKEIEDSNGEKFYKFLDQDNPETIVSDIPREIPAKTRMEVVSELINKVQLVQEGFIACLNGPSGVGKSNILNALKLTFEEDNSNIWLLGQCSLQSKTNTLFFFKDLLQNLFDIPAFNIDIESTKKRVFSYLSEKLNITDENLVNNIFAILFYDETRLQNAIYMNKQNTYNAIAAIFRALLGKGAVVLQIEDIENIDNFSLEIIRSLFEDGILKCNLKIFITSNIDVDITQFFASPHLNKDNTFFVQYPVMSKAEIDDFIVKAIGVKDELGTRILNHIYENAKGLPIYVEEFLYSLLQLGLIKFTNDAQNPVSISNEINNVKLPKTVSEIIQLRLTNVSNIKPDAFKALYYASILGFKFLPAVVQNILQMSNENFEEIIKYLAMNNFIAPFDSYNYSFKSRVVWEIVRNLQLSAENQASGVKITLNTLLQLTMPDMSPVVKNLLDISVPKYEILNYIEQATKDAYAVGDDYSYIYHKSILLEGVELSTLENKNEIMLAIKEELLNLTYITFPDTALKYADELLSYYEPVDTAKTIDILGLMSVSFETTGNYLAAVECVDKALEKIDSKDNLIAGMLLNYSKLNSILQLGRYEELINISQTAILPVLELFFKGKINDLTSLNEEDFRAIEFETKYLCSVATALQGSPKCNDMVQNLYSLANETANTEYSIKAQLTGGIFKLLQGEIDELENILSSTQEIIPSTKDATFNTLIWLILKNIGRYFKGEYSSIANELLMLSNFSLNIKQFALEPIIRGFLVKLALREGNVEFAQNLAYELFYKCSNNQWAFGALLNWYMYTEIAIFKENYDEALKVAQNALDVSEKANINNIFFSAMLKLKIAQIYSYRGDCDMAKINAAEAIQLADMNGYEYIKALSGIIYYDILLKQITLNPALKNENIKALYTYLLNSQDAVEKLKNSELAMQLKQKTENIIKFAQDNSISLE